jgi:AraC-like DNA-binding protein
MHMLVYIVSLISLLNNDFSLHKIYDDNIFYNFVSYEGELYVSSNTGIYKINTSAKNNLKVYNTSILGPIKSDFSKDSNFKIKFRTPPKVRPQMHSKSTTDFAYHNNDLFIIAKGKLLVYRNLSYTFTPHGSVRSITKNAIGSYNGVYINDNKINKITYTDGQIKEFDSITFVCYNGLLSYKDNIETIMYDNDNSIRTKGEYGNISDIFLIRNSQYLVISNKGIFNYNYKSDSFNLIYESQSRIIPIRNKIDDRIKDRGEFHFIDKGRYISLNVNSYNIDIIDDNIPFEVNDILESDVNGNDFYAISENKLLLTLKRTKDGLMLINERPINITAHTITDYNDLIFLSGNNGLSVFDKTKKQIYDSYIIDEFNSNAVYKSKESISFGSIHGVYAINNIKDFQKNLVFENYKINDNKKYLYFGAAIFIILITYIIIKILTKKNITDDQLIKNIKRFIHKNLNSVTLKMLESEFNLDYNDINSLSKDFIPAKYIKHERLELTKKLLLHSKSISEVSEKTGYSESYLMKNKYKFKR